MPWKQVDHNHNNYVKYYTAPLTHGSDSETTTTPSLFQLSHASRKRLHVVVFFFSPTLEFFSFFRMPLLLLYSHKNSVSLCESTSSLFILPMVCDTRTRPQHATNGP